MFLLLPTAPSSLLYMRAGAPSAALPPGYAVVDASTFAGTPHASTPLPVASYGYKPSSFVFGHGKSRKPVESLADRDGVSRMLVQHGLDGGLERLVDLNGGGHRCC